MSPAGRVPRGSFSGVAVLRSAGVHAAVGRLAHDARSVFAHLAGTARAVAHAAVRGVGIEVGTAIAAKRSFGRAVANTRSARSPARARVVAHAAVIRARLDIDARGAARRHVHVAATTAAGATCLAGAARIAAIAAVHRIGIRVDASVAARIEVVRAIGDARPARAHFARFACGAASAAVRRVGQYGRADARAIELSRGASAGTAEAGLIGLTSSGARAAMGGIACDLDARSGAVVEALRACAEPLATAQWGDACVAARAAVRVVGEQRDAARAAAVRAEGATGRIGLVGRVGAARTAQARRPARAGPHPFLPLGHRDGVAARRNGHDEAARREERAASPRRQPTARKGRLHETSGMGSWGETVMRKRRRGSLGLADSQRPMAERRAS